MASQLLRYLSEVGFVFMRSPVTSFCEAMVLLLDEYALFVEIALAVFDLAVGVF